MAYLTHKHTSNECAMSIVTLWCWPAASITYKNPVEITDGNFKQPIASSNLLSMIWARVSRWRWFRASGRDFRGPKHVPCLQTYPQFRGVLCLSVIILMLFMVYDNSLLADSLNGQIASSSINFPAIYSNISSVGEERYTVFRQWWVFNKNRQFHTFDSCAPGESGHQARKCCPKS